MSDEIKDMDDVEAQAWSFAFAAGARWAESHPGRPALFADECVRLLRERRSTPSAATMVALASQLTAAVGREANAVAVEREKVVAHLRRFDSLKAVADAIGSGEHDR